MNIKKLLRQVLDFPTIIKNYICFCMHRVNAGKGIKAKGKIHIVNKGQITIGKNVLSTRETSTILLDMMIGVILSQKKVQKYLLVTRL